MNDGCVNIKRRAVSRGRNNGKNIGQMSLKSGERGQKTRIPYVGGGGGQQDGYPSHPPPPLPRRRNRPQSWRSFAELPSPTTWLRSLKTRGDTNGLPSGRQRSANGPPSVRQVCANVRQVAPRESGDQ